MTTMKAWQFANATAGGIEKNMFVPATGAPKPLITDDQVLVEVYSVALNPADYKMAETWFIAKTALPSPKVPCSDFCGRVAEIGSKVDSVRVGEMVFGACDPVKTGSLAQFVAVPKGQLAALPDGVDIDTAASMSVAGLSAYQSMKGRVKKGDKVFINGGSGGCGVYAIQIAKVLGCHVTVSCSAANIEFCKSLGADEVLDYRAADIMKQLEEKGPIFDLAVDNVGTPANMFKSSHTFLVPTGAFVQVGLALSLGGMYQLTSNMLLPGILGGGRRKYHTFFLNLMSEDMAQVGVWLKEGKIRGVIDSTYEFDDAQDAFTRLKTGRSKGKIIVHVKKD